MIILEKYGANMAKTSFENPTSDQVVESIEELNGVSSLGIQLKVNKRDVMMHISENSQHIHIRYSTLNERGTLASSRILVDSTQQSDAETSFLLENGQIDDIPIRETVYRHTAVEIALYFLEYGDMPKGLLWDPPM